MRNARRCRAGSFFVFFVVMSSCGTKNDSYHVTPSGEYDKLQEPVSGFSRCTSSAASYGCGSVSTTGNIVRTDFVFRDLFVTCGATESGYAVSFRNSIVADSSFQMVISLYGVSSPPEVALCKGPVGNGAGGVIAGSCDVSLQVHATSFASTSSNECLVKFLSTSPPINGTVFCGFLESGVNFLTITQESSFTCP
jgi:hypothetical protein